MSWWSNLLTAKRGLLPYDGLYGCVPRAEGLGLRRSWSLNRVSFLPLFALCSLDGVHNWIVSAKIAVRKSPVKTELFVTFQRLYKRNNVETSILFLGFVFPLNRVFFKVWAFNYQQRSNYFCKTKLKPKNCNRGQLFRPCRVSSARCSKSTDHTVLFWAVGFFRCGMLLIFNMVCPWFSCGTVFLSVHSLLIAATTWYSGFFLLSLVTRFACDISQSAKIWIWLSSEVITICIYWIIGRPVDCIIVTLNRLPIFIFFILKQDQGLSSFAAHT